MPSSRTRNEKSGGSYTYPLNRPSSRGRYDRRQDYLSNYVGQSYHEKQLCQAIGEVIQRGPPAAAPRKNASPDEVPDPFQGFPWLTLVLGSGCLELPDEPEVTAAGLAEAVGLLLDRRKWPQGSDALASIAQTFTMTLVADRMRTPNTPASNPLPTTPQVVEPMAAQLALIAALLTRFFHWARSASPSAMSRWDDDVATFDPTEAQYATRDLAIAVLEPVTNEIADVKKQLDGPSTAKVPAQVRSAVSSLLNDITLALAPADASAPRVLRLDNLRLITEVAWHFLTLNTSVYPGWSDLLLSLLLNGGEPAMKGSGRRRPRYSNLEDLPTAVRNLIAKPTTASWKAAEARGEHQASRSMVSAATPASDLAIRQRLYDGAAQVLWAQARAVKEQRAILTAVRRKGAEQHVAQPPPAVAYVTSFDLELDMALWRSAGPDEQFAVALPVHLIKSDPGPREAQFCWVLGHLKPGTEPTDRTLSALLQPKRWRLLTSYDEVEKLSVGPIVVHLAGSPLFEPPTFAEGGKEDSRRLIRDLEEVGMVLQGEWEFAHAVTVDEYLALRQSEAELFWTSDHPPDARARTGRGLPPSLTGDGLANTRFWMAIGVPMADPAVRRRVVSQLTSRWIRSVASPTLYAASAKKTTARSTTRSTPLPGTGGLGAPPPGMPSDASNWNDDTNGAEVPNSSQGTSMFGVAINRQIADDETGLLFWLGFDVVLADCRDFTSDLNHYAHHVASKKRLPTGSERCPVANPPKT